MAKKVSRVTSRSQEQTAYRKTCYGLVIIKHLRFSSADLKRAEIEQRVQDLIWHAEEQTKVYLKPSEIRA